MQGGGLHANTALKWWLTPYCLISWLTIASDFRIKMSNGDNQCSKGFRLSEVCCERQKNMNQATPVALGHTEVALLNQEDWELGKRISTSFVIGWLPKPLCKQRECALFPNIASCWLSLWPRKGTPQRRWLTTLCNKFLRRVETTYSWNIIP